MRARIVAGMAAATLAAGLPVGLTPAGLEATAYGQAAPGQIAAETPPTDAARWTPLLTEVPGVETMRVVLRGRGGYEQRDNCPQTSSHTNASFEGGTYTLQGGFADGEIAAVSYTLPGSLFPLKVTTMEFIIGQQNASVTTTTEWSVLVWEGTPSTGTLVAEFNSDGSTLAHVVMGPGTRATNVQASVDPNDPDQLFIFNPQGLAQQTFSIGFRIDRHNAPSGNPCVVAPSATQNAFPATDNTVIGCGTGYAQLNRPSDNWLFALNCGPNGCPPNGGWTRFSGLQTDTSILGICLTGCRPRGDWVMRATWDPVNCPPPEGACCFGTAGCFLAEQTACQNAGGTWRGPGTVCGTPQGGQFPGCVAPPNTPPTAEAGADQTLTDTDGDGMETVIVDGAASTDPDPGDFIANFRWSRGGTVLQDGPAFLSTSLPVGVHTLTLTVTDSRGDSDTDEVVITIEPGVAPCDPDFNVDGNVDQFDVACLALVVAGDPACSTTDPDFNRDGNVDQSDIQALEQVVAGAPCP
ncbi:MAG: hypothetical protein SFY69_01665 [Planctomycetota bacterium]|nr:hypothetical protein [Planctomycetota bacterium]